MKYIIRSIVILGLLAVPLLALRNHWTKVAYFLWPSTAKTEDEPSTWTIDQWIAWRDKQINQILEPTSGTGPDKVISRAEVVTRASAAYALVQPLIIQQPDFFTKDPDRAKQLGNFIRFITAQHWMSIKGGDGQASHALGLSIPDVDYWSYASKYADFPPLMKTQDFLKAMADPRTYKVAVDMINKQNQGLPTDQQWIVLPFVAQFIKSVDGKTYGRMLILIPNVPLAESGVIDKWVLFSIALPDQPQEVESVSIIAVYRQTPGGGESKSYPVDFVRRKDTAGEYRITPTVLLSPRPSTNCYNCHKASILPIRPEMEFTFDSSGRMVPKTTGVGIIPAEVNRRIRGYGPPDFGVLDSDAYGPSIGPTGTTVSDEFIRDAARGTTVTQSSFSRIRNAMNCARCHDDFAKINYIQAVRSDFGTFKLGQGIPQTYIEKGWMPPITGNSLNPDERHVLWVCLMRQYFDPQKQSGVFVDWLKGGT
jgi:hypothetical protein